MHDPYRLLRLVVCALALSKAVSASDGPVIHTDDGPIQGTSSVDGSVLVYRGIPIAAPPVGALRFKGPVRPTKWTKVIKTTDVDPQCPQLDFIKGTAQGQEDCLYATVYVPKQCTAAAPCPVMQWIYGGAWIEGSDDQRGVYNGTALARQHGVVVVTSNYRVDSLGWIALPELMAEDEHGSFGNYGLKDQRMALRWTQRNVAKLGGNPNKVAIFGESAGGFSVCQHVVSPASNGLFSSAIMESGDCDGPWNIHPGADAQNFGSSIATYLGCPPGKGRLACLRAKPLKDVLVPYAKWICKLQPQVLRKDPWCNKTAAERYPKLPEAVHGARLPPARWPCATPPFAPIAGMAAVVDGTDEGLPDTPLRLMQKGKINRSPTGKPITMVLGTNTDELALFLLLMPITIPGVKLPITADSVKRASAHLAQYHVGWNASTSAAVDAAYPIWRYRTQANRLTAMGTDFCFRCGTRNAARALAAQGVDTYVYNFDFHVPKYKDPASLGCELLTEAGCGVAHAQEYPYIWQRADDTTAGGRAVAAAMGLYWTNVAKTGSPNSAAVPVQWPKYDEKSDRNLKIDHPISVVSGYARQTCDFWDTLPRAAPYVV
eukprot:g6477.t1